MTLLRDESSEEKKKIISDLLYVTWVKSKDHQSLYFGLLSERNIPGTNNYGSSAPLWVRHFDTKGQKKCCKLQKECKKGVEQMELDDFGHV